MLVPFNELAEPDNRVIGQVFINPRHVIKVRPVKTDGMAIEVSIITDVNKEKTRVEGRASQIHQQLNIR